VLYYIQYNVYNIALFLHNIMVWHKKMTIEKDLSDMNDAPEEIFKFCDKYNPISMYSGLVDSGVEKTSARMIAELYEKKIYRLIQNYLYHMVNKDSEALEDINDTIEYLILNNGK